MANYLEGEQIAINAETLKQLIGKRVEYLQSKDIDKSGRGYFYPRIGTITNVFRRQIEFNNNQDYQPFSSFKEMVILEPVTHSQSAG